MAFPSTPILDNFSRTENPLSTGWVGFENRALMKCATSIANSAGASQAPAGAIYNGINASSSEVFATPAADEGAGNWYELFIRMDPSRRKGFILQFSIHDGWTALYRFEGGVYTQIDHGDLSAIIVGDEVGVRAEGDKLSVYRNRVQTGTTVVDSTFNQAALYPPDSLMGSGYIGFGGLSTGFLWTNFGGGTYFGTTPLIDNFNRTEDPLSQTGGWGSTGIITGSSTMRSNGSIALGRYPPVCESFRTVVDYADCEAYFQITNLPSNAYEGARIFARISNPGTNASGYMAQMVGSGSISLYKITGGNYSGSLGTYNLTLVKDSFLGISCKDSVITVWYKANSGATWKEIICVIDESYSHGTIGIGSNWLNPQIENFGGGGVIAPLPQGTVQNKISGIFVDKPVLFRKAGSFQPTTDVIVIGGGHTAAALPLATSRSAANASLALSVQLTPIIPLGAVSAHATSTLALRAKTTIPFAASTAHATSSLTLTSQPTAVNLPLASTSATSSSVLGLRAKTRITLTAATAHATSLLTLTVPTPTSFIFGACIGPAVQWHIDNHLPVVGWKHIRIGDVPLSDSPSSWMADIDSYISQGYKPLIVLTWPRANWPSDVDCQNAGNWAAALQGKASAIEFGNENLGNYGGAPYLEGGTYAQKAKIASQAVNGRVPFLVQFEGNDSDSISKMKAAVPNLDTYVSGWVTHGAYWPSTTTGGLHTNLYNQKAALRAVGWHDKLWLTEWGYATGDGNTGHALYEDDGTTLGNYGWPNPTQNQEAATRISTIWPQIQPLLEAAYWFHVTDFYWVGGYATPPLKREQRFGSTIGSLTPKPYVADALKGILQTIGSPPETQITGGPAQNETITTQWTGFTFSSNDPAATFECKIDSGAWTAPNFGATGHIMALANGSHTFSVRAKSSNGTYDPTPASRTFNVQVPTSSGAPMVAIGLQGHGEYYDVQQSVNSNVFSSLAPAKYCRFDASTGDSTQKLVDLANMCIAKGVTPLINPTGVADMSEQAAYNWVAARAPSLKGKCSAIEWGNEDYFAWGTGGDVAAAANYARSARGAARAGVDIGVKVLVQAGGAYYDSVVPALKATCPDIGNYAGGWTMHPYWPDYTEVIPNVQGQIAGMAHPDIWVTEWGLASDDGRGPMNPDAYGWPTSMTYQDAANILNDFWSFAKTRIYFLSLYQAWDQDAHGATLRREGYFGVTKQAGSYWGPTFADKGAYTAKVRQVISESAP